MIYEQWLATFTNWRPVTKAWQSFSIADEISSKEVRYTYERLFDETKYDYKLLTELVMVLNHKSFQHNEIPGHKKLCELYTSLYLVTKEYALDHLSGDELSYFLDVTD